MLSLITLLWNLCVFRSGPEDLPANNFLLGLVIASNATISIVLNMLINSSTLLNAATLVVVSLAGTAAIVLLVLSLINLASRFLQTFTALVGVDLILTLLTGLVAAFTIGADGNILPAGAYLLFAIMIWNLAAFSSIFQRAMNVHLALGVAVAIFVVVFSIAIGQAAIE